MEKNKSKEPIISDLTLWYTDLSYFPTDYKESRLWMAQSIFFAKLNSQVLQTEEKAIKYRKTDYGDIDSGEMMSLIDPPTSKSPGGNAEYFSSDRKALPIDAHLDNIMDATIRTIPLRLNCTLADPIAKLQEQKDKEKTINQRFVRNIINDFVQDLGMPKISETTDPYRWIQNFTAKDGKQKVDEIGDTIDQIRLKIKDDDGYRLFQNYLYKNGLEVAFEIGIKYYLLDQNEFNVKYSQSFLRDLKHFNKVCGRWAIDETSGQGMVKYIDPTQLYTSPFKDKNGDDILYFYYEENVNMAEFERLVGTEMSYDEKKKALELQKKQGWTTGTVFRNNSNKNNSQIRLGFFSVLTQEANAFSERYITEKYSTLKPQPLTWEPDKDSDESKKVKVYNVWYSCYYLPLNIFEYNNNTATNWQEQSKYIFHIKKDVDMMRYGADKRYVKSSLVVYKNDKQLSWTDIKEAFMPKINLLWQRFQNCIVQDVSGLALDYDLLGGMLNAVDDANAKDQGGGNAVINEWKMLREAGSAWFKFRDKNGNMVVQDPSKLFIPIDSGHMRRALEVYFPSIMELYNLMTQALAKGQASEGLQPSARTPLGGIEIAKEASSKATYFIEQGYIEGVIIPYAMRCAQHIHCMAKENKTFDYKKRWKQFVDVIGSYNGAVIESIEDINFENIGLTVNNDDDSAKTEIVVQQIVQRYAQKQLSTAALGLVLDTDNWKLQIVELSLEEEKANEKAEKQAELEHQRNMESQQMQLQIAQALNQAKTEGKNSNIETQSKFDALLQQQENQLKASTMASQKEQLLNNKLQENQQKAELDKDKKSHEANLEVQKPLGI